MLETTVTFWSVWLEAILNMAIPLAVIVWALVATLKPVVFDPISALLARKLTTIQVERVMKALYTIVAFALGIFAAAYVHINPFYPDLISPGWFAQVPVWVGYVLMGSLIACGETLLYQGLGILNGLREWLKLLKPPKSE